ncbi:MAG: Asp-tRNA(Asn)/Glu-tRNA(Gln) amidotransferase subunit GatC [Candidatus Aquirickettsiella sp.]
MLKDVNKIADLARIQINPEEATQYLKSLQGIFDLASQMDAVDTRSVQPVAHPFGITQRLRADAITETVHRKEFQQLTLHTEAGLYCVPLVLE